MLRHLTLVTVAANGVGHARNPPLEYGTAGGAAGGAAEGASDRQATGRSQLLSARHGIPLRRPGCCNGNTVGRPVRRRLWPKSILSRQSLRRGDVDHDAGGGDLRWRLGGAWRGLHFHVRVMLSLIFAAHFLLKKQNFIFHLLHLDFCLLLGTCGPLGPSGRGGRFRFFFGNQVES